jgi:hypothetical protein
MIDHETVHGQPSDCQRWDCDCSPVRLSDHSADLRGDHRNNHAGVRLFDAMPDLKNQLEFAKLRAGAGP